MTNAEISQAVGNIHIRYIQEAENYFNQKVHPVTMRRLLVFAAILTVLLSLCAFTYTYFSTIAGDTLILTAKYVGEGIVLAEVQNQS